MQGLVSCPYLRHPHNSLPHCLVLGELNHLSPGAFEFFCLTMTAKSYFTAAIEDPMCWTSGTLPEILIYLNWPRVWEDPKAVSQRDNHFSDFFFSYVCNSSLLFSTLSLCGHSYNIYNITETLKVNQFWLLLILLLHLSLSALGGRWWRL